MHLQRRARELVGQAARLRAAPGDFRDERALAAARGLQRPPAPPLLAARRRHRALRRRAARLLRLPSPAAPLILW